MKNDYDSLNEGMRSQKRAKRRKTNLILNSLIVIVILLIGIVSFNIFFSNDESAADQNDVATEKSQSSDSPEKKEDSKGAGSKDDKDSEKNAEEKSDSEEADEESAEEQAEPIVTEGGSDANVKQTIENPEWKPVGTTQTGEHNTVFDQNAADWQEMILAYSYATGIDKNNMTVWWNENGGAPNTAVGTISEKGSDQTFRVWIQWVDGEGWKPVKVEELIQNDKR
ncbi:YrrS family protein [Mesobacillus sp. AQ2]|uniref:YrrS family protein n=1 Tax=Bacillaceae TaxID=186817 RepID=UPI0011A25B2F|nr:MULTISPECIES: YrrS family protein [Bacillaceae]WHX39410.1 YrrS family protein [Mesobacillus sp. AQ2]